MKLLTWIVKLKQQKFLKKEKVGIDLKKKILNNLIPGGGQFNFGYDHLRFIIFLEWHICAKILFNQSVK